MPINNRFYHNLETLKHTLSGGVTKTHEVYHDNTIQLLYLNDEESSIAIIMDILHNLSDHSSLAIPLKAGNKNYERYNQAVSHN